jgi:hypothetical protein
MVAPHGLSCGHTFCGMCLSMWVDGAKTDCPECRANVIRTPRAMFPIYKLDGAIEVIAQMLLNEREMKERIARKAEWNDYYRERYPPPPSYPRQDPTFSDLHDPDGLRRYRAFLREQCFQVLRGSPVTATSRLPPLRSRPIPIPRGAPRSN